MKSITFEVTIKFTGSIGDSPEGIVGTQDERNEVRRKVLNALRFHCEESGLACSDNDDITQAIEIADTLTGEKSKSILCDELF